MQASPFVQLRELDSAIREIAKAQLAIKTTQEQLARRWRDLFIRGARRCDGSVTAQIAAVVRARSARGCHTSTPHFSLPRTLLLILFLARGHSSNNERIVDSVHQRGVEVDSIIAQILYSSSPARVEQAAS